MHDDALSCRRGDLGRFVSFNPSLGRSNSGAELCADQPRDLPPEIRLLLNRECMLFDQICEATLCIPLAGCHGIPDDCI